MPLGIVSDEDYEKEKGRCKESSIERITIEKGRGNGNSNVPPELRELVAECGIIEGNKSTAKAFNVSEASVSAYKHGSTSTATYDKNDRVYARKRVAGRVQSRMLEALNFLTDEKIAAEYGKNIRSIVKDLAVVAEKFMGKNEEEKGSQVHLHIYSPKVKSVNDYEIIDV